MTKINVPEKGQLSEKSQSILNQIEKSIGKIPNLYAVMGLSENALGSYMQLAGSKSSLSGVEKEAVNLAVSEENQCLYCLSAHSTIAKGAGISEEEIINFRKGTSQDAKLAVIAKISKEIVANKGKATAETLASFFEQGYTQAQLIDIVLLIADRTFTNYLHKLTDVAIDFPIAKALQ